MGLGPSFAVLQPFGRYNPGFTFQVDFGPFGADHFARPQTRQQRDFKGSGGDPLSLVYCGEELRRLLVIKGSLPATGKLSDAFKPTIPQILPSGWVARHDDAVPVP